MSRGVQLSTRKEVHPISLLPRGAQLSTRNETHPTDFLLDREILFQDEFGQQKLFIVCQSVLYVLSEFHNFLNFRVKPAVHDTCFPVGLLAGLESCHIGCDAGTDSIAANTMTRF